MIDTHLHILPGVDDGPETIEESLSLARILVHEGIHTAIATPHANDEYPRLPVAEIRTRVYDLQQVLNFHDIPLRLFAGHEALIKAGLVEDIQAGRLATLNGSSYLLLELWNSTWLPETEQVIFELRAHGIIPIIAHPERYRAIQQDPARLAALLQRGALAQLTAGSLVGMQGNTTRRCAETLLKKGLIQCIASDAHGLHRRPPGVIRGLRRAVELVGQASVHQMTEIQPAAFVNNQLMDGGHCIALHERGKQKMSIGYALGNVVLAARAYENWPEVITAIAKKQEPAKVILKNGFTIEAEVGLRFLVREIFFTRIYNPSYLPIGGNDIVVDIGANNGVFTLFAASLTRNAVYAFEPSPRNVEILRRNIAINKLHHVTTHGSAVSDKIGSAKLFLNAADGQQNLLSDRILPAKIEQYRTRTDVNYLISRDDEAETSIEVPTTTLQEIIDSNNLERIDFLKLDCEGAESPILQSTPTVYLQRVRKISMEFHDHLSELNHGDLQHLLEVAGFHVRLKWDGRSPLGYMYAWQD